jgi:hypothetical protein
MDPEVFQMFNRVPNLGIALDLGNFELLKQPIVSHPSGEQRIGTHQEPIHRCSLALVFPFHLPSHAGTVPLQVSNLSVQVPGNSFLILPEINLVMMCHRKLVFLAVLSIKIVFVVVSDIMLFLPKPFPVNLRVRLFGD